MNFRSGLKVVSLLLFALLVAAVFMVVALMYADPTKLKEQIETLAAENGVELQLRGDVGWALFPNIQLMAEGATLSYVDSSMKLDTEIDHFNFSLKAWPALRGDLEFVGAEIEGAEVVVEFADAANAEDTDLFQSLQEASALLPKTNIANLRLAEVDIRVVKQDKTLHEINLHYLEAENVATNGHPFPVRGEFDIASLPNGFKHFVTDGYLIVDPSTEIYSVDFGHISIGGEAGKSQGAMQGLVRTSLDRSRNHWSWEVDLSEPGKAGLSGNFTGTASPVNGYGRLESNISDLPSWLASTMGEQENISLPIKMLALDAELYLTEDHIELSSARLRVDGLSGRGHANYLWGEHPHYSAHIDFQELNLDQYLSQTGENEDSASNHRQAAISPELLSLMRSNDIEIAVSADTLYLLDQEMSDLAVTAQFDNGLGHMNLSAEDLAGGSFLITALAELSQSNAARVSANFENLQLDKLSSGQGIRAQGGLSFNYDVSIDDLTRSQIFQGIQGEGQISITDLAIPSMNIEQTLCESAELVGATPTGLMAWQTGTFLGDIGAGYVVQNGVVEVEEFEFDHGNMNIAAAANLGLDSFAYDIHLEVEVNGTKTSENGCNLNKYAQGIQLPLQCSGDLNTGSEMSCGVDANIAERLVLQQVGGRLIESVLGQLGGERVSDSGAEAQGEESDQTRRDELRAILEGMLKDIDN